MSWDQRRRPLPRRLYLARRSRDGAPREGLFAVIRAAQGRQIQTLLANDASGLLTVRLWTGPEPTQIAFSHNELTV